MKNKKLFSSPYVKFQRREEKFNMHISDVNMKNMSTRAGENICILPVGKYLGKQEIKYKMPKGAEHCNWVKSIKKESFLIFKVDKFFI